jgi:hypothetical protein
MGAARAQCALKRHSRARRLSHHMPLKRARELGEKLGIV